MYKASLTKESKVEAKKTSPDPKFKDGTPKNYQNEYGNASDQDTSTQLVRIGISLDSLCLDHSTIESPAGQINGEVLLVLNKQRTKDDVRPEITTTGENTFKDVLYKIVKTYLKTPMQVSWKRIVEENKCFEPESSFHDKAVAANLLDPDLCTIHTAMKPVK